MGIRFLLPLAIAVSAATPAVADFERGSLLVRAGAAYMDIRDDNVAYGTTVAEITPTGETERIPVYINTEISLDGDTTWFINGSYFFANHWALELYHANKADLGVKLDLTEYSQRTGVSRDRFRLNDFETHVTSLYIDWYPGHSDLRLQPYLGLGISYLDVKQRFINPVFSRGSSRGRLDVGSSVDWTAQVGVDIQLGRDHNWLLNASVMYVNADPDLELGFDWSTRLNGSVPVRERGDLKYDSWIFNLGFGYRFNL